MTLKTFSKSRSSTVFPKLKEIQLKRRFKLKNSSYVHLLAKRCVFESMPTTYFCSIETTKLPAKMKFAVAKTV